MTKVSLSLFQINPIPLSAFIITYLIYLYSLNPIPPPLVRPLAYVL